MRITVWNEFEHEKCDEAVRAIYPDGIHGCIAGFLREAGFDVMKAENMELLTVRGYTDELWRRYARGPQVFVRQATQSTVRVVRKRD